MLELNVAALLGYLLPSVSLKRRYNIPAIHSVYKYTLVRRMSTDMAIGRFLDHSRNRFLMRGSRKLQGVEDVN